MVIFCNWRHEEGADRGHHRPDHQPGPERIHPAVYICGLALRARLCLSTLFRFLRLQRHGRRPWIPVWNPLTTKFQFALQGFEHHRTLATLAHLLVRLSSRLPIYPVGWQSRLGVEHLPKLDRHDAARRIVAWSQLDVCFLWRLSRPAPMS